MANLPETATWEAGIYQIEVTDPVQGGVNGVTNTPLKQLVNRTAYLKTQTDLIPGISEAADDANELAGLIRGSGAVIKHAVVSGKHTTAGLPDFIAFTQGAGTGGSPHVYTIQASESEPLVITMSGGYRDNAPVLFYARVTANVVLNLTNNLQQLIVARWNELTGAVQFFLTTNVAYTIGYNFPGSPSSGEYFYNLRDERMYLRGGSTWSAVNDVILASSIPNSAFPAENIAYTKTIRIGIKDLYGRTTVPAGTVHTFAGPVANIPPGYLLANGAAVSKTVYADLYAAIGGTYGEGSTTFTLPDLRGEFIRGLDNGRGIDTGRTLGSAQADELKSHDHNIYRGNNTPVALNATADSTMGPNVGDLLIKTANTGGSETRPRNIAMNFIIKF
jgi:microcystin-dependent protein